MSLVQVFAPIVFAAVVGGGSAGALGVVVVGLRMPFLAVVTAHTALAGAVFGELVGVGPGLSGFVGAVVGAGVLGAVLRTRQLDTNVALGTLFSLSMGLAFLGIGLGEGARSSLLGLLWGSLLFVGRSQLIWMSVAALALTVFLVLCESRLQVLLFSRQLAAALLANAGGLFALLLVVAAGVIAVNLQTVGGLLLYSLVSNPAVAALRIARSWRGALAGGALLGAASAVGGFVVAYWLSLPVGACIVLVSSAIVGVVLWGWR